MEEGVRGSSAEAPVLVGGLVDLGDGGLQEAGGHSDDGEHPHPEYGAGPSDHDGHDRAGDVTHADTGPHAHAEDLEGGQLALLAFGFVQEGYLDHLLETGHLDQFQAHGGIDASADDQDEGDVPDVLVYEV